MTVIVTDTSSTTNNTKILEEAIALAREGYNVFPVHISKQISTDTTLCTCGNTNCNGKHPSVKSFSNESTTDIDKINRFGQRWECRGIGIHLRPSYKWVLDVDAPDGYCELEDIINKYGELPYTRTVKTGGGGIHYYFAGWVDKIHSGKLTEHIDIKGNVGDAYVVAPPTLHHSGNRYIYANRCKPVDAPEWLINLIQNKLSGSNTKRVATKEQIDERRKYEIPLEKLLSSEHREKLKICGGLLRGDHPKHGSKNHRNFAIDITQNRWFCNRCESYGGFFELAAILGGICDCSDFRRDITIPALQGKKFVKTVQYCIDIGIDKDELKQHISRGAYLGRI